MHFRSPIFRLWYEQPLVKRPDALKRTGDLYKILHIGVTTASIKSGSIRTV